MSNISIVSLTGITVAPIFPTFQATGSMGYPVSTTVTPQGGATYDLLFVNADGQISKDPGEIPSSVVSATLYYQLAGSGGTGEPGSSGITAIGYDAIAAEFAPVVFSLDQAGFLPSGTFAGTARFGVTLAAPTADGVTQSSNYEPAVFSYWYNLDTGVKQITGDAGQGFQGIEYNGPLVVPAGVSGLYLAVYVAPPKPTGPIKVWPPIHPPSNCPALLANLAAAANALAADPGNQQLQTLLTEAQQAAAPCIHGPIIMEPMEGGGGRL